MQDFCICILLTEHYNVFLEIIPHLCLFLQETELLLTPQLECGDAFIQIMKVIVNEKNSIVLPDCPREECHATFDHFFSQYLANNA